MKTIIKLFFYIFSSLRALLFFTRNNTLDNSVLIISNGMSMSGAPLVLLNVIEYYKSKGLTPIVLYEHDGLMRGKTGCNEYCCFFFEKIIQKLCLQYNFKSIFINTIACNSWINFYENQNIEYNLWIHEGEEYFSKLAKSLPKKITSGKVFCVSEISKACLEKYVIQCSSTLLNYPFDYKINNRILNSDSENKIVLLVGSICRRKNQLELVEAIKIINERYKNEPIKFVFIGAPIEKEYGEQFSKEIKTISNVEWISYMKHEDMMNFYKDAYVVVCTCTDDPLPVTITEAIFSLRLVLVSSGVGQYRTIKENSCGYTYETHNIYELTEKIVDSLDLSDEQYKEIVKKAYIAFADKFSKKVFFKTLDEQLLIGNGSNHEISK